MNKVYLRILIFGLFITIFSCKENPSNSATEALPKATIPKISGDSAYAFVEKQLSFGVRVPGTDSHLATKDWIVGKMKSYGAAVDVQEFNASFLTKKDIKCYNIIAKINPNIKRRIAFFAHWDTRLIAEKDLDLSKKDEPILGAIDGASGVAALLEMARIMQENPINLGIDFVFFDAEDQGDNQNSNSWCLGSQYWAKSVKDEKNKPKFGILLDLIGAKDATYGMEGLSMMFAPENVKKIWALANGMGKTQFKTYDGGSITDDHAYVNSIANIPTIDIIQTNPNGQFASYHHTHDDNLTALDKDNLAAVIQVVTAVAYKESEGSF